MTPRVVVAGTHSGVGKTTVATGLMAALATRGHRVAGFKVGPDFIDPSYHALASGRPGRNLDAFLSGPELVAPLFAHGAAAADVAVIEGVMGLFDGARGRGELASTAQCAKLLGAPVLLVVDASGLARSAAALVFGFIGFDPAVRVAGVVLNRVASARHEAMLREALAPLGVPVLGVLRRDASLATPERHLGLVPAAERAAAAARTVAALGEAIAATCDLAAIVAIARGAPPLAASPWDPTAAVASTGLAGQPRPQGTREATERPRDAAGAPPVAVAAGPAFTFRYEENLELLRACGAEPVPFDPTADEALPEGTAGLYLGGGFPETYGEALSANGPLRAAVRELAASGRPVLAECGGLLYLARDLDGLPLCGVVPAQARMTSRLALGYRHAVAATSSPLAAAGRPVRGHEFHYSALDPPGGSPPAWSFLDDLAAGPNPAGPHPAGTGRSAPPTPGQPAAAAGRAEGFARRALLASYLHTHWAATPDLPARFVRACAAAGRREPGA